jgi:hypothetical protein
MTTNQLDNKNSESHLEVLKSESSLGMVEPSSTQPQNTEPQQTSTIKLDSILMPPPSRPQKVSSIFEEHNPQQTPSPSKIIYGLQPTNEETNGKHSLHFVNYFFNLSLFFLLNSNCSEK